MNRLPVEGSRERGKVVRLEPYGAFVQFERFPHLRGLVHISEMANYRVERTEDVVSLDDIVDVRVLAIESNEVDGGRMLHRIQLSLKDDAPARRQQSQVAQQLESNLNSSIGMGVAKDPMSHLILKQDLQTKGRLINGYALVDDTEGEPPLPQSLPEIPPSGPRGRGRGATLPAWMTRGDGGGGPVAATSEPQAKLERNEVAPRPMGRGRANTLPAWMTRGGGNDGPVGGQSKETSWRQPSSPEDSPKHSLDDKWEESAARWEESFRRKRHDRKDKRSRKRHREAKKSRRDGHGRKYHHHRDRRSRSRSHGDDHRHHSKKHHRRDDEDHHHRSRRTHSPGDETRDHDRSHRHYHRDERSSRGRSPSRRDSVDSVLNVKFSSVEEAKKLIAKLESKKQRHRLEGEIDENQDVSRREEGRFGRSRNDSEASESGKYDSGRRGYEAGSKHGRESPDYSDEKDPQVGDENTATDLGGGEVTTVDELW